MNMHNDVLGGVFHAKCGRSVAQLSKKHWSETDGGQPRVRCSPSLAGR